MKIAVATLDGTNISGHFGKSPYFTIFIIDGGRIASSFNRKNDFSRNFSKQDYAHLNEEDGRRHAHLQAAENLADCSVLITGNMGQRAWDDLTSAGIDIFITEESIAGKAVEKYLAGTLINHSEKLH